jgi:hypothetical protein
MNWHLSNVPDHNTATESCCTSAAESKAEEAPDEERTIRHVGIRCQAEEPQVPALRCRNGAPCDGCGAMGLRLVQLHRLRHEIAEVRASPVYLTLTANRPATLIPIIRATSEFAGSITTTSPVQSSLRLVCLQFGQTGPALIIRQFLQALSLNFWRSFRWLHFQVLLYPFKSS